MLTFIHFHSWYIVHVRGRLRLSVCVTYTDCSSTYTPSWMMFARSGAWGHGASVGVGAGSGMARADVKRDVVMVPGLLHPVPH